MVALTDFVDKCRALQARLDPKEDQMLFDVLGSIVRDFTFYKPTAGFDLNDPQADLNRELFFNIDRLNALNLPLTGRYRADTRNLYTGVIADTQSILISVTHLAEKANLRLNEAFMLLARYDQNPDEVTKAFASAKNTYDVAIHEASKVDKKDVIKDLNKSLTTWRGYLQSSFDREPYGPQSAFIASQIAWMDRRLQPTVASVATAGKTSATTAATTTQAATPPTAAEPIPSPTLRKK